MHYLAAVLVSGYYVHLQLLMLSVVDVVVAPFLYHLESMKFTICCALGNQMTSVLVVYSCFTTLADVLYGWNILYFTELHSYQPTD